RADRNSTDDCARCSQRSGPDATTTGQLGQLLHKPKSHAPQEDCALATASSTRTSIDDALVVCQFSNLHAKFQDWKDAVACIARKCGHPSSTRKFGDATTDAIRNPNRN